jgi:hypothetical protein
MWPFGSGQIQTLVQAGGMTRALIRARVASSFTGAAVLVDIGEALAVGAAADALLLVVDIGQQGAFGGRGFKGVAGHGPRRLARQAARR